MSELNRPERLQIMLNPEEIRALDDWRFAQRMPSRAAAIRELLRRGLGVDGPDLYTEGKPSTDFGVLREAAAQHKGQKRRNSQTGDGRA